VLVKLSNQNLSENVDNLFQTNGASNSEKIKVLE
jgi:hypothetical protein